jgi:hypothetical protein
MLKLNFQPLVPNVDDRSVYWFDAILNPQKPTSTSPDEEFAKYDFRLSAGKALGGGMTVQTNQNLNSSSAKPALQAGPKKKKASGGC